MHFTLARFQLLLCNFPELEACLPPFCSCMGEGALHARLFSAASLQFSGTWSMFATLLFMYGGKVHFTLARFQLLLCNFPELGACLPPFCSCMGGRCTSRLLVFSCFSAIFRNLEHVCHPFVHVCGPDSK